MSSSLKVHLPGDDQSVVRQPGSDRVTSAGEPQLDHLTVEQRLAYLREQFTPSDADDTPKVARTQPKTVKSVTQNTVVRRIIKTAAAAAIAGLVVWAPAQRLFQTTSVEAIVNARTFTLRAPIDGIVSSAPTNLAIGSAFKSGAPLLHITNIRADRSRVDDLRRLKERGESELASLKVRLSSIERMHGEFVEQTRLFQKGRIAQLEARIEEGKANLSAAATRQEETAAVLERAIELSASGFQPKKS